MKIENTLSSKDIAYLQSEDFIGGLRKKNLKPGVLEFTEGMLKSEIALNVRASELLEEAKSSINTVFWNHYNIMVPFSGGRDSTLLAILTAGLFPQKNILLSSVWTNYFKDHSPAKAQFNIIRNHIKKWGGDTKHLHFGYLDLSTDTNDFVLGSAVEDAIQLGHPGTCSRCKILMEIKLTIYALLNNYTAIGMGYVKYQGDQNWPEQSIYQINTMEKVLKKHFPTINLSSPLYHVLETPIDSILLLSKLGISHDNQKQEMGCLLGGTNPKEISSSLPLFVENSALKLIKESQNKEIQLTTDIKINHLDSIKKKIELLKKNPDFMNGIYDEKK